MMRCLLLAGMLSGPMLAAASPPSPAVAHCVQLAAAEPKSFTATLRECVQSLDGPELMAGLHYRHTRPAVTARVVAVIDQFLCPAAHTESSARSLLDRVREKGDWSEPFKTRPDDWSLCLHALGQSPPGRAALRQLLLSQRPGSFRVEALRALVRNLPQTAGEDRALQRYRQEADAADAEELRWRVQDARPERVRARVEQSIRQRRPPLGDDLLALVVQSSKDERSFRLFLALLQSNTPEVRQGATQLLYRLHDGIPDSRDGRRALRHALLESATFPQDPFTVAMLMGMMDASLKGVSRAECLKAFERFRPYLDGSGGWLALAAQATVADRFDDLRPRVLARFLSRKAPVASIEFLPSHPWLTEAAHAWVRAVTDQELRRELIQERFLIFARGLSFGPHTSAQLPATRRAHHERILGACGNGLMEALVLYQEERADAEAFGLPESEMPNDPGISTWVPAAPPLTPTEATVRWQRFVLLRPLLR